MPEVIFTCEHGGNLIPPEYAEFFQDCNNDLGSHRGWDVGILPIAKKLASDYELPFYYSEVSRLLVELNRSLNNPELFSRYTSTLSTSEKEKILSNYYFPFRDEVEHKIRALVRQGKKVLHISFHSFTPVLNGEVRHCDIGLLFDPARSFESEFCKKWEASLKRSDEKQTIRLNYPYQGIEDGFTTYLRTLFSNNEYAGIEIEINQKNLASDSNSQKIYHLIKNTLQEVLSQ